MQSYVIENFIDQKRVAALLDLFDPTMQSINSVEERDELFKKWEEEGAHLFEDDGTVPEKKDSFLGCFVDEYDILDITAQFPWKLKGALILRMLEPSYPHAHAGLTSVLIPLEGSMEFIICNEYSEIHSKQLDGEYTAEMILPYEVSNALVFDAKRIHYSGEGGDSPRTHLIMDYI
jgi:hypothetical protein